MKYSISCVVLFAVFLFSGCATHTGVVTLGENKYKIFKQGASGFTGSDSIKSDITLEASNFCSQNSKTVYVTNVLLGSPPYIFGNFPKAEIQFKCVTDEELASLPPSKSEADGKDKGSKNKETVASVQSDKYADLKKLKSLLDEKVITPAEFEIEKKKLLEK